MLVVHHKETGEPGYFCSDHCHEIFGFNQCHGAHENWSLAFFKREQPVLENGHKCVSCKRDIPKDSEEVIEVWWKARCEAQGVPYVPPEERETQVEDDIPF